MKLDGENMNITSIVIIKRIIGFTYVILFLLTDVYAQENEISIDLELVSVWESEYQPSPQGLIKGDTLPEIINFEFIVYNHTDKALMFSSNSHLYYHPDWNNSEYGEIGRFLMINGVDTISLYTKMSGFGANTLYDNEVIWGSIESFHDLETHPVFRPFLNRWNYVGRNRGKELYNYLKDCQFIYVPIQSDYQRRLDEFEDNSMINQITYPRDTIKIKKKDPFEIIVNFGDSEEEYYIYPPISIKQDE